MHGYLYTLPCCAVRVLVKVSDGAYDQVQHTLKSGECFGVSQSTLVNCEYCPLAFCIKDIAISKQQPRSSTCVASTTAEFLVISKSVNFKV